MLQINGVLGTTFTALDPNTEYLCVGTAFNGTLLIVGAYWDQPNNRTQLKTFQLKEVYFKGKLDPTKS